MYPLSPTWLSKLFDGGRGAVIAGVIFGYWLGQTMANSNRNHWHEIAKQANNHFREAGYHLGEHEKPRGQHTEREHERRQYRHEDGHERGH